MRNGPYRAAAGLVAATTATVLLAGCSGDDDPSSVRTGADAPASTGTSTPLTGPASPSTPTDPTVAVVFGTARTAALSATSGHVTGSVQHEDEPLRIEVEGSANGANQTVFITTEEGGTSEVVMVRGRYFLGGDEAFWVHQTGDPAAGRAMVGKYVAIDESAATELGAYSLRGILTGFFELPEVARLEADPTPAARTELAGRPAYVLGEEGSARLWVAADGSGTVLRIVGPPSEPSDLVFSGWERARTFTEPPASAVVEG